MSTVGEQHRKSGRGEGRQGLLNFGYAQFLRKIKEFFLELSRLKTMLSTYAKG